MASSFRILDLPDELRLKIYGFILPHHERIFIDPHNIRHPLPLTRTSYGETIQLLQLCKKIHAEAIEYIYSKCTINIIRPMDFDDVLMDLGAEACRQITSVECHLNRDLGDIGSMWETMNSCAKLEHLTLVFYHERYNWPYTVSRLCHHIATQADLGHSTPILELELYESIWPRALAEREVGPMMSRRTAIKHAKVYEIDLPSPLKKITVTASVFHDTPDFFANFGPSVDYDYGWTYDDTKSVLNKNVFTWEKMEDNDHDEE